MAEPNELLRMYLGEPIPEGGSDSETMFSEDEIQNFLDTSSGVDEAAVLGWTVKAANLSHLVDMAEGSSRRSLRQQWENAIAMTKHFSDKVGVISQGRTRIRDIERT